MMNLQFMNAQPHENKEKEKQRYRQYYQDNKGKRIKKVNIN